MNNRNHAELNDICGHLSTAEGERGCGPATRGCGTGGKKRMMEKQKTHCLLSFDSISDSYMAGFKGCLRMGCVIKWNRMELDSGGKDGENLEDVFN